MKPFLGFLALLLFYSCTPTIILLKTDSQALNSSIDARNNNAYFEDIHWKIDASKQTDNYITMDIQIHNNSDRKIDFHPLDFYYSHELYFHRIHALDPFYIDYKIKNPMSDEYDPKLPGKNVKITTRGKEVNIDPFLIALVVLDESIAWSYQDLKYISRNKKIKKELIQLKSNSLLEPQVLDTGQRLEGQLIFPKVYMHRLDKVNIKWRYNEACIGKQFKVL